MKRICIYGKGGIGKSTVTANVAAALAVQGLSVAVVGCDPKADSTRNLTPTPVPTVLAQLLEGASQIEVPGFGGIMCIESGGPKPGTGCAGHGIVMALEEIKKRQLLEQRDVVIYDVLGDVVCGGFSAPMREQVADQVYLVTTDDYMSVYAANNISKAIVQYAQSGDIRLGGIIHNGRSSLSDVGAVELFAKAIGTTVIGKIPMDSQIGLAEIQRKTVVEAYPNASISTVFGQLAQKMMDNQSFVIPRPMEQTDLEALYQKILKQQEPLA